MLMSRPVTGQERMGELAPPRDDGSEKRRRRRVLSRFGPFGFSGFFIADTSGAEKLPGINSGGPANTQSRDQRFRAARRRRSFKVALSMNGGPGRSIEAAPRGGGRLKWCQRTEASVDTPIRELRLRQATPTNARAPERVTALLPVSRAGITPECGGIWEGRGGETRTPGVAGRRSDDDTS